MKNRCPAGWKPIMKTRASSSRLKEVPKRIALLLWVLFLFSVCAEAAEDGWRLYHTTPDGTEHYYDVESITRSSKAVLQPQAPPKKRFRARIPKRRIKVSMVKVREKLVYGNPGHRSKESKILREFDCSGKTTRTLMISETYKNGSTRIEGRAQPWEDIGSKPSYKALFEIVCKP